MFNLPEFCKIVQAIQPGSTSDSITCDYVSLKNVHKAWIIVSLTQVTGHATGIDPMQATAVAGTGAKAFVKTLDIWANENVATSDALVKKTSAITYNVVDDVANKQVIFEIDPAKMDIANGFDVLGCTVDGSGVANYASIIYVLDVRYKQGTPPSAIVD